MTDDRSDLEEAVRLLREWAEVMKGLPWGPDVAATTRAFLTRHPEKPKLLGCPWCGGEPELATPKPNSAMRQWRCHNCAVTGPWGYNETDAAAAWNRRATPASGPLSGGTPE